MAEKTVVILTKLGQLRGLVGQSVLSDKSYYGFLGIPYGIPPVGALRFKDPQPFGSWEGVRDATEDAPSPIQPVFAHPPGTLNIDGEEDCLYLNVFINQFPDKSNSLKPVVVVFNQGAFLMGSGNSKIKGPDYFLESDIVVVTFNFRLGALGFLSLENEEVPGNAGLKDQTLALKWVHDNIDSFGGDPNNVTIFGISAGGTSVHFHLLSPTSRGLFHKAVTRSGTALNPWSIQENPQANAIKLAKTLGCTSEDPGEVLRFLQAVTANDIVNATNKMSTDKEVTAKKATLIFLPCVEVSSKEPFLEETPESLMESGQFAQVPIIIGGCVQEGVVLAFFGAISDSALKNVNENPAWLVPSFLELKSGSKEEKEAQEEIWDFYFKGNPISWSNVQEYIKYQSDVQFNVGIETTRTYLIGKSSMPVYTYLFTNHSRCKCILMKNMFPFTEIYTKETCHGADCLIFYKNTNLPLPLTPDQEEVIKKSVQSLAAFASTGDPNCGDLGVTWNRDSQSDPCYMDVGTTWVLKDGTPFTDRMDFWKGLIQKYRRI
ncbi:juvenile hormone esterase-like [Homalodisca vitripennis]|uniref:juvenile hormone esterase-like n=1 Tax=Homalodisca vitripennis TaxID=197043 RepID=UPI001EEBE3FA|nr:juvenile hormone esterase-like [Homalodisca vitripennis]